MTHLLCGWFARGLLFAFFLGPWNTLVLYATHDWFIGTEYALTLQQMRYVVYGATALYIARFWWCSVTEIVWFRIHISGILLIILRWVLAGVFAFFLPLLIAYGGKWAIDSFVLLPYGTGEVVAWCIVIIGEFFSFIVLPNYLLSRMVDFTPI